MQLRDFCDNEYILEYCDDIAQTIVRFGDDQKAFRSDKAYHDLICFYLLQIGELAGQLSPEMRDSSAGSMKWSQIKGMRNVVAHHYGSISLDIVWNTVKNDIPQLRDFCDNELRRTAEQQ